MEVFEVSNHPLLWVLPSLGGGKPFLVVNFVWGVFPSLAFGLNSFKKVCHHKLRA